MKSALSSPLYASALFALLALIFAITFSIGGGLWDPIEVELIARLSSAELGARPIDVFLRGALALGPEQLRLVPAAFGLLTLLLSFGVTALVSDRRAAFYALLLLASTPLFILNSRLAIGASPAIFAQLLAGVSFFLVLEREELRRAYTLPLALVGALLSVALAGVLLGLMPGLIAALIARFIKRGAGALREPITSGAFIVAIGLVAALITMIAADSPEFSLWLGGAASGDPPPAFHRMIERAFHGLLPLSAFVPALIAFGLFNDEASAEAASPRSERDLTRFLLLFAAASYLSGTLYEARYGVTTFLAAPAIAIACALAFRALERRGEGSALIAITSLLLLALGLRDLFLFPDTLLGALPMRGESLPESASLLRLIRLGLGLPLIIFGVIAAISIGGTYSGSAKASKRPSFTRFFAQVLESRRARAALALGALVYLAAVLIGLVYQFAPAALPFRSIVGYVAAIVALVLPSLILAGAAFIGLRALIARAPHRRGGLLALSALPLGLSLALLILPALDAQLSPKGALELLAKIHTEIHAERHEGRAPIYAIDQNPSALALYSDLEIDTEKSRTSIQRALPRERRVFLLFPSERLAELNRELWTKAGRHLVVLHNENPSALLATNLPLEGFENKNALAPLVLAEPIEIAHPVEAELAGGYQLLGYEIVSDRGALEAGRKFTLRLFWTTTRRHAGSYDIFVHLEGRSGRMHGDHAPLRGLYATRDWSPGDFLIDEHELRVPGHFAPGTYTLHVGLYRGKNRAEVVRGPSDGKDRVIAGEVELR